MMLKTIIMYSSLAFLVVLALLLVVLLGIAHLVHWLSPADFNFALLAASVITSILFTGIVGLLREMLRYFLPGAPFEDEEEEEDWDDEEEDENTIKWTRSSFAEWRRDQA